MQLYVTYNSVVTRIYEKEENLYTYLPFHSCHSPGVTYGSIYGGLKRIFDLTSLPDNIKEDVQKFYQSWLNQGHNKDKTRYLFHKALKVLQLRNCMSSLAIQREKPCHDELIFHHMEFSPRDPPAKVFQLFFRQYFIKPHREPHISKLKNIESVHVDINPLIIAYHNPNSGTYLSQESSIRRVASLSLPLFNN